MAVSAHPRPGLRDPAEKRELEELARALDARPAPARERRERPFDQPGGRSEGPAGPDTVEVSTFAALRTSGVVAGLAVLAMTLALLLAGQALHLGWPATPLNAGGDGRGGPKPVTYPLSAPPSSGPDAAISRPDQRRTGDHATSLRDRRGARRGRSGRGRRDAGERSGSPRSGDRKGPRSGAPSPGSPGGSAPGRGSPGGDPDGWPVAPPSAPRPPAVEVPGWAPVPSPRLPAGPIEP